MLLTVSLVAQEVGVTAQTIRNWADKGRIPFTMLPTGYRRWTPEQVEQIKASMRRDVCMCNAVTAS